MTCSTANYLIIGAGVTGRSVLRYLLANGCQCAVADAAPAISSEALAAEPRLAEIPFYSNFTGAESQIELLQQFDCLVVSPGVSIQQPAIARAHAAGVPVIGDIELFARINTLPVIAVTGSNGKSTVVSLVASILQAAGKQVSLVGNLGRPCLDAVGDVADCVVLELSSFQLETTGSLQPLAATVLNVSADHLDRYDNLNDYADAKLRIFKGAKHPFYNLDDALSCPPDAQRLATAQTYSFTSDSCDWHFDNSDQPRNLCSQFGNSISVDAVRLPGRHNQGNALVAAALASTLVSDDATVAAGLGGFAGLPHRMQLVASLNDVDWYNDSKGTNIGAAISAMQGLDGAIVLIAGGRGKNADYSIFAEVIQSRCRALILIGEDAELIAASVGDSVPTVLVDSMQDAVVAAAEHARAGDKVLLSPACASFDMFANFEARGLAFESEVHRLCV